MASSSSDILLQNCRPGWPGGVCIFANICGFISNGIWFTVLVPQLWKNFRRKSVIGLSVLWATANFTASLNNLFFVFKLGALPLYVKIEAVYMPILELTMLMQFMRYGVHPLRNKLLYLCACALTWSIIIAIQLAANVYQEMQWISVTLWCIETFPQVMLNMKRRSTSGQSTYSVSLSMIGKTTDFLSNYLLVMPLQNIIMIYFSSSLAYINGIQVALYPRELGSNETLSRDESDKSDDELSPNNIHLITIPTRFSCSSKHTESLRWVVAAILVVFLIMCVIGLVLNTGTFISLLAPIGIAVVIGTYSVVLHVQARKGGE
ncbi:unnamed protein product [Owenia fusiformis]|uniref:Uncharacterized protein n=1 Tax=Owenia fusiformis TaxID=6347 RepID=A0A8J1TKQ2_OWEFU|nr:unnamed protein product [Owenia fusiformis]